MHWASKPCMGPWLCTHQTGHRHKRLVTISQSQHMEVGMGPGSRVTLGPPVPYFSRTPPTQLCLAQVYWTGAHPRIEERNRKRIPIYTMRACQIFASMLKIPDADGHRPTSQPYIKWPHGGHPTSHSRSSLSEEIQNEKSIVVHRDYPQMLCVTGTQEV